MARPISITKERILAAALDIVRRSGPQALTARSLCAALGCGAGALFTSFGSIQGIRDAVKAEARRLYQSRVRAGFSLNHTPESLREAHPGLTKGDIRIYMLSHFQFPMSEQAILLGISPSSVTKARQRLKAKLQ